MKNKIKITLTGTGILIIIGIIMISGCVEEETPGSCTINNPVACNLSCEADTGCERTCCGCINENENCVMELDGMSVDCMLADGECRCVNGKCELFEESPKNDIRENQTLITEEQAIAIANATEEVQEFLKLYPDAELKTLQSCCASGKVLRPDMMCKCAVNAKSDWLIEYMAGDEGGYHASARIAIDEYSGEIIARYPEIRYLKNAAYCEKNEDCLCLGCSGVARPCCGCWNFVYKGKAFAGAWHSGNYCKCINNTCASINQNN